MGRANAWLGGMLLLGTMVGNAAEPPPPWAYGFNAPAPPAVVAPPAAPAPPANAAAAAPDPTLHGLPGTDLRFTRAEIGNRFGPADWYPGDHPVMPEIVAKGRQPNVLACALCHYPNGKGRPENSAISGLPVDYFIEQMQLFRDDRRKTADPRKANTALMATIAKGMTDEEIRISAEYYASIRFTPWIRVVETTMVPTTTTSIGLFLPTPDGKQEPIGNRLIEVPEDVEMVERLRSPRVGFIAYVPPGTLKKGEGLVRTGNAGKTIACGTCHGADLKGLANIPAIAGRSPSYLVRQMFDMKAGTRTGTLMPMMQPVVANLTNEDMLAIAAYIASLEP